DDVPPPTDGGEVPGDDNLPLPPEPQPTVADPGEQESDAKANQRHNQAAAAALNESLALNAQGRRYLDEVKSAVEEGEEARLTAIRQQIESRRNEYESALSNITERKAEDAHRRETVGVAQATGSAASVAVDRENNLD